MHIPSILGRTYLILLASLLMIGSCSGLSAQRRAVGGYVITLEGDTLRGRIEDRNLERGVLYNRIKFWNEKGKKKRFSPYDIQGYVADGAIFESKWYDQQSVLLKFTYIHQYGTGQKRFLRVLTRGPVTCYQVEFVHEDNDFLDGFELYLREGDVRYQRANQGIFGLKKKQLASYFSDCPELVHLINSETLTRALQVAEYYNEQCK